MTEQTKQHFNSLEFRNALSSFATGVTVVTTLSSDGDPVGATISSFNSVSMDPPLILWSIANDSDCAEAFVNAEYFAVNVLGSEQLEQSDHFARSDVDKFGAKKTLAGPRGLPLLEGIVAYFCCRSWATYPGGDHTIIVGEVFDIHVNDQPGLVFYRGGYATAQAIRSYDPDPLLSPESPELIDNFLLYHLNRAAHQMNERFNELVHEKGLAIQECRVLAALHGEQTLSLEVLSGRVLIDDYALKDIVSSMVAQDLIMENDTKSGVMLSCTASGQEIAAQLSQISKEQEKQVLGGTEYARNQLISLLKKVIGNTAVESNRMS